ncbi:MAG TPA: AMP-binding protein [Alphaproteobacteria bacterium]|nr:AMP-binding protein [Alphaproteobacteria bacterium]
MNLATHLARNAQARRDLPALGQGSRVVATWGEMHGRVARLAGALRGRFRLQPGDRVALLMKNAPAYAELMYACWHAGVAAVPINARLHPREIAYVFEHSGAAVVFASADLAGAAGAAAREAQVTVPIVDVDGAEFARLGAADPLPMADAAPDDLAWLFYTSGTTGRPKGAMLTHRNLLAMAMAYFVDIDPPVPPDASGRTGCLLHAAPMSHGSGLYMVPHAIQGACQLLPESGQFDPGEVFDILRAWTGVSMFAAPTMVKRLVDHPRAAEANAAAIRAIVFGGAPMYVADLKAAVARFGFRFAQLYGQGESPMTITAMSRALIERAHREGRDDRLGSAGIAQSVVEVRVADTDDRALPAGDTGEILVRGEAVMRGYWRDADASAAALRGGWLHTGDVGAFDPDGYLTLKDRSKDVIISGGSNIYPREIEEVLLRHPDVVEVSVIGAADAEWGERVVAYVVCRAGASAAPEALDRLCLDHIARFKRPKEYRFLDQLPKNNYGKVLKTELRKLQNPR